MLHWIAVAAFALNAQANDFEKLKELAQANGTQVDEVVQAIMGPNNFTYQWEVAEIEAPVPSHLLAPMEIDAWQHYLNSLSPARQIEKWAKALDEFHALAEASPNPEALDPKSQVAYYSKWEAAQGAAVVVMNRLQFPSKDMYAMRFDSDIEHGIFMLVDLLKSVHSPDAAAWEARAARHKRVSTKAFEEFLRTSPKPGWK